MRKVELLPYRDRKAGFGPGSTSGMHNGEWVEVAHLELSTLDFALF